MVMRFISCTISIPQRDSSWYTGSSVAELAHRIVVVVDQRHVAYAEYVEHLQRRQRSMSINWSTAAPSSDAMRPEVKRTCLRSRCTLARRFPASDSMSGAWHRCYANVRMIA